jgi:hypothetical protein
MIIKKPNDDIALRSLLELANRVLIRGVRCASRNHDAFTLIYMSTHIITLDGIRERRPGLKSLKEVIVEASTSYPDRFICILRTNDSTVFRSSKNNIHQRHEEGVNSLRHHCYTKTYQRNQLINHAKFVLVYHFCFDEDVFYHGRYYGSTNFTAAGLFRKNYEEFHRSYLRIIPLWRSSEVRSHAFYIQDAFHIVNERFNLSSPEGLKQYIDEHVKAFMEILERLERVISYTPLLELYNAFIDSQRLYLELLSFIGDLPGKKATSRIIEQIVSTVKREWEIDVPNMIELEMLEATSEETIQEVMKLLRLRESDIRDTAKKYLKAARHALKVFGQEYDLSRVKDYYDEIEKAFMKKIVEYGERHRTLLRKAIEAITGRSRGSL